MILDVQRSAMYDGPGIRTVIFLKGCPLSCKWCHNPEAQSSETEIAFFAEKCLNCGKCTVICPEHAHRMNGRTHIFDPIRCSVCGACEKACPAAAMKSYGYMAEVDELMHQVRKDRLYYASSGGGLTVSGGEPFYQYAFTKAIMEMAKEEGIHTCLETSGYTTRSKILESLSFTDFYLFDYKLTDEQQHRIYTGVSNRVILQNLDLLYQNGAQITLRCPVIPGINDNAAHFLAIRELERRYPKLVSIEILPYHDYGKTKERALGRTPAISCPTTARQLMQKWKEEMFALGLSEQIINSFG